ncbi:hypothetical protein [uncultured Enterovirga sp.]|uniref:hypothetical protein n=1 Tax=uncultured Enterovirga sp. TaxID=2026352 RepID=UPI0035CB439C
MAALTIRDDALWVKHIHDPDIRRHVAGLSSDQPVRLVIDGRRILFRKMRDGLDGRPTPGLRADGDDIEGRAAWAQLQARRGETVPLALDEGPEDPYLTDLDEFLHEWKTPEDAAAFDGL